MITLSQAGLDGQLDDRARTTTADHGVGGDAAAVGEGDDPLPVAAGHRGCAGSGAQIDVLLAQPAGDRVTGVRAQPLLVGVDSSVITVTWVPVLARLAAVSQPMKPEPFTATRCGAPRRRWRRSPLSRSRT